MALQKDFLARTNADWAWDIQFQSGGAPVDLTGADVRMSIVDGAGAIQLLLTLGQGLALDGITGTLSGRVSAAQMQGLPAGSYRHDIQIRRAGTIIVPVEGSVGVSQGVTRV